MNAEELKARMKRFALQIMALVGQLPTTETARIICRQLLRSATGAGANYRSACRARSKADFLSKVTIAEEEADESQWWLELLRDGGLLPEKIVEPLLQEARELTAILTASGRTTKAGLNR